MTAPEPLAARDAEWAVKLRRLAYAPETDVYRDEACRGTVQQPYANNRYIRLLDDLRALVREVTGE